MQNAQPFFATLLLIAFMFLLSYLRRYGLSHLRPLCHELKKLYLEIIIVAKLRRMNPTESIMLKDFIMEQRSFNKTILDEVHTIKRGLYGDPLNGTQGLIQRQESDEKRIEALEGSVKTLRQRMIWTGAGFLVGVQSLWEWIKWKSK